MKYLFVLLAMLCAARSSHALMNIDTSMYYSILNTPGTTQLDIWRGDKGDNIGLLFWDAKPDVPLNRLFKFVPAGASNEYRIVAAHSRKALTGRGKGKQIVQMPVSDDIHQIVAIDDMGDGTAKLRFTYSNMYFNGLGGATYPGITVGEWSEQKNAVNDVFKLVPYKTCEEIDTIFERDLAISLFNPFAEALKEGKLDQAAAIVLRHPPSERREALEAVVRIYRGDVTGGEAVLDRLAATSGDERLFDQISTLYERREYIQNLYSPAMNEDRFKRKGMEYLKTAVRIQLRKTPYEQKITMLPPVKGRWSIASGPMPQRAYHSTFMGFFGYDMWYPPGRFEDSFGRPVHAVADGMVAFVSNDNDDNYPDVTFNKSRNANMIILEHETGIRSLYVHLKKGSAIVVKGQRVQAGQQIASIGNSGFTSGPHLHFEISRIDNNFTLPVRMTGLFHYNEMIGRYEPADDPSVAEGSYSDSPHLPTSNGRSYSYAGGKFVRADGADWNEFDDHGKLKFRFIEKRRSDGRVYLYDQGRGLMLRFPEPGGFSEYSTDREQTWTRFQSVSQD
jgi:murein DD-endopeptidase MepM/ murein hydrolase activator NlpD